MHRIICFFRLLAEILVCWRPPKEPAYFQGFPQVICAVSFGSEPHNASNQHLAEVTALARALYGVPALMQHEIFCARELGGMLSPVCDIFHPHFVYINTAQVVEAMVNVCRAQGWDRVLIVCHQAHFWRIAKLFRKYDHNLLILFAERASNTPYAFDDPQLWVRSRALWILREIPTRIYSFHKGWI